MQAVEVNWLRWLFVMILAGIALAVVYYLGFYLPGRPDAFEQKPEELEEYPAGLQAGSHPIPAILWMLYIGMAIFIIAYGVYVWKTGQNF